MKHCDQGAREVHVRIQCPPWLNPCYFGIDVGNRSELIAAKMDVRDIAAHLGADSLGYLSEAGMMAALGLSEQDYCRACFTGRYPVPVQLQMDKLALET